jgi:hypothetical protein
MEASGQLHALAKERHPGTHFIRGWVSLRAILDAVVKKKIPSPRRESNPRTLIVQPVAQRYTDGAITALTLKRQMYVCSISLLHCTKNN